MKYRKHQLPERSLTETFVSPNYATETLINGNISECVSYLKNLLECGNAGINAVYDELQSIKENCPDRYNFIKTAVFHIPSYNEFRHH